MTYSVGNKPSQEELLEFTFRELQKIQSELLSPVNIFRLSVTTVAPQKPRGGDIYRADGTLWNPGSGKGVYWYDDTSSTWKFLG